MNVTMKKFGYPDTLIREYQHWVVLLRPQQATLAALVLVCKDPAVAFSQINAAAFTELKEITTAVEKHLKQRFSYDKINYLMLMMVDPDVHFHVLPRYAGPRTFDGQDFSDFGWPGPPDLAKSNPVGQDTQHNLLATLRTLFTAN
jgi:diadenosine tetraphosphate (Ap4A) HIT family hydrolase